MSEIQIPDTPSVSNDIAWEAIVDSIQDGKAILIVGGELFNHSGKNLDGLLQEAVGKHAKSYADGLFHFKGSGLILSYTAIKRFYAQSFPHLSDILDKIAAIPFPIVLSTTPDDHIRQAFDRQKLPFDYGFYFKRQPATDIQTPKGDKPLLYNLFGDLKERNSLVLTYDDLFDYLTSNSEGKSMPPTLKQQIGKANNIIFLGLPFDKWYVRLLLRVLEQHKEKHKLALKYAANEVSADVDIQSFCLDDFNITCIAQNINDFVHELHRRCTTAGLLRGVAAPQSFYKKWHDKVLDGQLHAGLDDLLDFFDENKPDMREEIRDLSLWKGQLSSNERAVANKRKTREEGEIDFERIRNALLDFLDEHKKVIGVV